MLISVAVVAYNEEGYLPKLLKELCAQTYPHNKIEILLIDSNSSDKTAEIMKSFIKEDYGFLDCRFFTNPKKNVPSGHNIAIDFFRGEALLRIDAHASIPPEFISNNVRALKKGEKAVGGRRPCIINRDDSFGQTLLSAENSVFGSGFAAYRKSNVQMYSTSLFCGMYKREIFDRVGKFNELLPRSEDNEMCYRIRAAGFHLFYTPEIVYYQYIRSTLPAMLRQKFLNGYWIGKTIGISPRSFSLFHLVPLCFVIALLFSFFTLLKSSFSLVLILASYFIVATCVSVYQSYKHPVITNLLLPIVFFLNHFSYGIGTLIGILIMPFWLIINRRKIYD